ncbi:hypothetical protein BC829DRAFT_443943 [Chytridium lagenaria]|nr:hypothetical protein BC829DRAFT_443943 [Chytridium lagenaria]
MSGIPTAVVVFVAIFGSVMLIGCLCSCANARTLSGYQQRLTLQQTVAAANLEREQARANQPPSYMPPVLGPPSTTYVDIHPPAPLYHAMDSAPAYPPQQVTQYSNLSEEQANRAKELDIQKLELENRRLELELQILEKRKETSSS